MSERNPSTHDRFRRVNPEQCEKAVTPTISSFRRSKQSTERSNKQSPKRHPSRPKKQKVSPTKVNVKSNKMMNQPRHQYTDSMEKQYKRPESVCSNNSTHSRPENLLPSKPKRSSMSNLQRYQMHTKGNIHYSHQQLPKTHHSASLGNSVNHSKISHKYNYH